VGKRPGAADDDGLITCLMCGRRFRSLGPHIFRIHHVTAADYRTAHGLPATAALMATETRAALSATRKAAMAEDPELVGRMRAAALPAAELSRRSASKRATTSRLPLVRQARRRGWDVSVQKSAASRADSREELAKTAGFASWHEAIEATRAMPSRQAAELLDVGKTMVLRWRRRNEA
jgi:predicted transcriptional regulator